MSEKLLLCLKDALFGSVANFQKEKHLCFRGVSYAVLSRLSISSHTEK